MLSSVKNLNGLTTILTIALARTQKSILERECINIFVAFILCDIDWVVFVLGMRKK